MLLELQQRPVAVAPTRRTADRPITFGIILTAADLNMIDVNVVVTSTTLSVGLLISCNESSYRTFVCS